MNRVQSTVVESDLPPWKTRVYAVLALIGLAALYYFLGRHDYIFFRWAMPFFALVPVWTFIRGPHIFFSADNEGITWSADRRRQLLIRFPWSDIQEIQLVDDGDCESLELVDARGVSHPVKTAGLTARHVFKELQKVRPDAKFRYVSRLAG